MKIILTKDIHKLGNAGDVLAVKDGYARNYLLPRKFALVATPMNLKKLETIKSDAEQQKQEKLAQLKALAEQITSTTLTFVRKVDESSNLYGSVSDLDIVSAFAEKGIVLHRASIEMEKPYKELGTFELPVHLGNDIKAIAKINIEQE